MAFVAHNHMALCLLYARVIPKIAERRVLDLDGERVYVSRVFQRNRAVADQLSSESDMHPCMFYYSLIRSRI